jgi:hypothetical protein
MHPYPFIRQPCGQPTVRDSQWPRHGHCHIRLVTNLVDWIAFDGSLVGSDPRLCGICVLLLVPLTNPVLHKRTYFPTCLFLSPVDADDRFQSWYLAYFPMGGQTSYDRFGNPYKIGSIFNQTTHSFNVDAYNAYSALYLPGPFAIVYLIAFALATALLTHTILYHGKSLIDGIKKVNVEEDDIHAKLMRRYPEVPDRWYTTLGIGFFILGVVAIEVYPTQMPVYALALSILLPALYMLPVGFVYAVTSQGIAINLLAELIPAGLLPGEPLPNMVCYVCDLAMHPLTHQMRLPF